MNPESHAPYTRIIFLLILFMDGIEIINHKYYFIHFFLLSCYCTAQKLEILSVPKLLHLAFVP
jgi:hypothetical protein